MSNHAGDADEHPARRRLPAELFLSSSCGSAAELLGAGLGTRIVTLDWGSFDTHGDQLALAGPAADHLSRALGRVPGRPGSPRHRGQGDDAGVLGVRPAGRLERLRRHRPRRRRPDDGVRLGGQGRARGEFPNLGTRRHGDLSVETDFRSVYQALISEWLGGDPAATCPAGPYPGIQRYDGGTTLLKAA